MLVLVEVLNDHILEHERVTITLTSPLNLRFQGSHAGHKVNAWLKVVINSKYLPHYIRTAQQND